MNKEIKKKWLAALRSGKYKQTRNQLREVVADGEDGFCCLGVLCDVVNPNGWDVTHEERAYFCNDSSWVRDATLPPDIQDIADIDEGGDFRLKSLPLRLRLRIQKELPGAALNVSSLSGLNDAGASFELIADIIEADPTWTGEYYEEGDTE